MTPVRDISGNQLSLPVPIAADTEIPAPCHGDAGLRRALGLPQFVAIGINICVGGSIFLIGSDAYRLAGPWSLAVASMVGLFALVMGFVIAELASRFEGTGGPYLYARVACGPFVGFQVAWMMWFTRVLAQASLTSGIMTSIGYFRDQPLSRTEQVLGIVLMTAATSLIHLRGIAQGARIITFFAVAKLLPLLAVLALGVTAITPPQFAAAPPTADLAATALLLLFTFSGYEVIPVTAGEGGNPKRDAPLATVISIAVMVVLWLTLQLILISVVPNLGGEPRPVTAAGQILGGDNFARFVTIGAITSAAGTCLGTLLVASRSLYAVADDRLMPAWFGRVDATTGAPHRAILFSTGVVLVLALSGSFVFLAAAAALPRLVVFAVCIVAMFRLRRQDKSHDVAVSGFRVPFAGILAGGAMIAIVAVLPGASASQLLTLLLGLAAGTALFFLGRRTR